MATYNLNSGVPSVLEAGDVVNVEYSGSMKSLTLPKGTYKLECWGASGNAYNDTAGVSGKGGYSVGTLTLTESQDVYCYAGGQGSAGTTANTTVHSGGFNGGGQAYGRASSGGGGSDIRIGLDSLYARVIVAGGGGGAPYNNNNTSYNVTGGAGGGESGVQGSYGTTNNATYRGGAGTQTSAGSNAATAGDYATAAAFGTGAGAGYYSQNYASGGAGGGWYGGGVGRSYYAGGSGGSGFVFATATKGNVPNGYLLDDDCLLIDASTTAGSQNFTGPTGSTETGHSGNGYVRITVISLNLVTYDVDVTNSTSMTVSPEHQEVNEGGSATIIFDGTWDSKLVVIDNGVDVTHQLREREVTQESSIEAYPGSYTTSGSISGTYYQQAVGKSADGSSVSGNNYCSSSNSTAYISYAFDFSDIPSDATINSVTIRVKGHCESTTNSNEVARVQAYSGSNAKGSSTDFTSTSDTIVTLSAGSWTREELDNALVRFTIGYYGGNVSGITFSVVYEVPTESGGSFVYTISRVTENHTVLVKYGEQLLIKLNGTWTQVKKIYKEVNGTWTEVNVETLTDHGLYIYKG